VAENPDDSCRCSFSGKYQTEQAQDAVAPIRLYFTMDTKLSW
jgi:hypothetical protein